MVGEMHFGFGIGLLYATTRNRLIKQHQVVDMYSALDKEWARMHNLYRRHLDPLSCDYPHNNKDLTTQQWHTSFQITVKKTSL